VSDAAASSSTVAIGGVAFELTALDRLDPVQRAELARLSERGGHLETLRSPTADDEREYRKLSLRLVAIMLPGAPRGVIAALDDAKLERLAAHLLRLIRASAAA
jgi:hypothetical protein